MSAADLLTAAGLVSGDRAHAARNKCSTVTLCATPGIRRIRREQSLLKVARTQSGNDDDLLAGRNS